MGAPQRSPNLRWVASTLGGWADIVLPMTMDVNAIPEGLEIPVELLDAPAETRREVLESIWFGVVRGISDLETYRGCTDDVSSLTEEQERVIVEYVLAARRAQQATFTEIPEPRLDRAFAALRKARIIAERNFACCGTCGEFEIGTEQADEIDQWLGYVFYHRQDIESLIPDGQVRLSYGIFWPAHITENELTAKSKDQREKLYDTLTINLMNEVVIPILKGHGIGVEWNQQMNRRIQLTGIAPYFPID